MSTTTKKRKAIRKVAAKTVMIAEPDALATPAQKKVISDAVHAKQREPLPKDEWKALTKGRASEIISELRANNDDVPASAEQKRKISDLVHRGFLKGYKRDTFKTLTNGQAKKVIYKGLQNEANGLTVEPSKPLVKTERQTQLVHDGYLNPFTRKQFNTMTHEAASKFIGIGKSRQAQGTKAPEYIREPEAA
jgi:hypothetical protein